MSVGLYAMFVSILVPGAKKSWLALVVAALGGLLTWGLAFLLPRQPAVEDDRQFTTRGGGADALGQGVEMAPSGNTKPAVLAETPSSSRVT